MTLLPPRDGPGFPDWERALLRERHSYYLYSFKYWEHSNSTIPCLKTRLIILLTVLVLIAVECLYYIIAFHCSRKYLELELLAFFLCGLNLLVVAADVPNQLLKQLIAIIMGLVSCYTPINYSGYGTGAQT